MLSSKGEEEILCPYNNAHLIRRSRMTVHLVKCSKNYPNQEMVLCDFNTNHRIPKPEIQYHHETCPDRKKIEIKIAVDQDDDDNKYPVVNFDIPTEEDWDQHVVPSYNPEEYCQQNAVVRNLKVQPPSMKKNFRAEERQRLGQLRGINKVPEIPSIFNRADTSSNANQHQFEEQPPPIIESLKDRVQRGRKKAFIQAKFRDEDN